MTIHRIVPFVLAATIPLAAPAANAAADWSGFYMGLQVGHANGDSTFREVFAPSGPLNQVLDFSIDGTVGGVHAGYNYQMGQWVVGAEGDVELSDISGFRWNSTDSTAEDVNWLGSLRLRAGWTEDALLFFVTGGLAYGDVDMTLTEDIPIIDTLSGSDDSWGYTAGAGVEFAFTPAISGRIEYRYIDFGKTSVTGNIYGDDFTYVFDNEMDSVRVGVTWHFNR